MNSRAAIASLWGPKSKQASKEQLHETTHVGNLTIGVSGTTKKGIGHPCV
jgi:hypothetical protein